MTWRYWEARALCAVGGRRYDLGCLVWARDVMMAHNRARRKFGRRKVLSEIRIRPYTRDWHIRPWPQGAF